MDSLPTPGEFSWSELTTRDVAAAKTFYAAVFGWTLDDMPMPGQESEGVTYTMIKVGERGIGGIMSLPPNAEPGMPPVWHSYVSVEDIEGVAEEVRQNGGAICAGPHEIPGIGTLIVFTDPQGATLCAIEYVDPAGSTGSNGAAGG